MSEQDERVYSRAARMGVCALAAAAALLAFGAGTAGADVEDIEPDPFTPTGSPLAEGGVRSTDIGVTNAGPSEVRVAVIGAPLAPAGGESKDSIRAVPSITGGIGTYINMGPFTNGPSLGDW